jgi:flagellar FliL protein
MSDTSPTAAAPGATAPAETPAPAGKSKIRKWIIIGAIALVVLGGGGGAAAWWFTQSAAPDQGGDSAEAPQPEKPTGGGIIPMDQFLVNLADKDASRFVRVKLGLVVETKAEAEDIVKDEVAKTRLRSAILEVLAQQTADRLVTPEGKTELKKAITERAASVIGTNKVLDVLFTDFVVQF